MTIQLGRRFLGAAAAACLLAATGAGCSSSMSAEERAKKSRAELSKHEDALRRKVTAIQALSRIALPPPEERITAPAVPLVHASGAPGRNLVFIPVEQLADLTTKPATFLWMDVDMRDPPRWLSGAAKIDDVHPNAVTSATTAFLGLEYVLILKALRHVPPVVGKDAAGKGIFSPGAFAGEAHLYGIDGKRWGGVSFAASSSESVRPNTPGQDQAWVDGDLKDRAHAALRDAVKKHLPDAKL